MDVVKLIPALSRAIQVASYVNKSDRPKTIKQQLFITCITNIKLYEVEKFPCASIVLYNL